MVASAAVAAPPRASEPRIRRGLVAGMTVGHLANDSYANFVPILMPLLAKQLGFSLTLGAVATTVYMLASSLTQPFFGHYADRHNVPLIAVAGVAMSAMGASFLGVMPSFFGVLVLSAICGLGMAAYHPQAASTVYAASGMRKGSVMSIYMLGGNLGLAASPLIVSATVDYWGLSYTPVLLVIGVVAAAFVYYTSMRVTPAAPRTSVVRPSLRREVVDKWSVLSPILAVVSARAVTHSALVAFLPFYLERRGMSATAAGALVSVMFFAGALFGFGLAYVADRRQNRHDMLFWMMVLSTPAMLLLILAPGASVWVASLVVGATLIASFPILTTTAQSLMPNNVGLISGVVLGFSQGLGGIAVTPLGFMAEALSVAAVIGLVSILPIVGAVFVRSFKADTSTAPGGQVG